MIRCSRSVHMYLPDVVVVEVVVGFVDVVVGLVVVVVVEVVVDGAVVVVDVVDEDAKG